MNETSHLLLGMVEQTFNPRTPKPAYMESSRPVRTTKTKVVVASGGGSGVCGVC